MNAHESAQMPVRPIWPQRELVSGPCTGTTVDNSPSRAIWSDPIRSDYIRRRVRILLAWYFVAIPYHAMNTWSADGFTIHRNWTDSVSAHGVLRFAISELGFFRDGFLFRSFFSLQIWIMGLFTLRIMINRVHYRIDHDTRRYHISSGTIETKHHREYCYHFMSLNNHKVIHTYILTQFFLPS
jgi:hypothetical protein